MSAHLDSVLVGATWRTRHTEILHRDYRNTSRYRTFKKC